MRLKIKEMVAAVFLTSFSFYAPASDAAENAAQSKTTIIKSPSDYANTPWAKLNIPAGTKLSTRKTEDGKELHSLEFTGGVTMSEEEGGRSLSVDNSKGGAVMCAWEIYTAMKVTMDKCHPEETELRENFDLAIEKLESFIVANSLTPITKSELEDSLKKKREKLPEQCSGEANKMSEKFIANKSDLIKKFQKSLDESLATPRPPVLNPCL